MSCTFEERVERLQLLSEALVQLKLLQPGSFHVHHSPYENRTVVALDQYPHSPTTVDYNACGRCMTYIAEVAYNGDILVKIEYGKLWQDADIVRIPDIM